MVQSKSRTPASVPKRANLPRKAKKERPSLETNPLPSTPSKQQRSESARSSKPTRVVTPSPERKAKKSSSAKSEASSCRTFSLPPLWSGTLATQSPHFSNDTKIVEPHTLIIGTHPSQRSLANVQYYGHPMNAFWWIAGDCLGFRRGPGVSRSTGAPYALTQHLRHDTILPYPAQLERLVQSGFALWDIVASCPVRRGSLDATIRDPRINDIRGFCAAHPTMQRMVLSNGRGQLALFRKHFSEWMASGQLVVMDTAAESPTLIDDSIPRTGWTSPHRIEIVPALPVSPAAAMYTYQEKRDFWEKHVYQPGLKLLADRESHS